MVRGQVLVGGHGHDRNVHVATFHAAVEAGFCCFSKFLTVLIPGVGKLLLLALLDEVLSQVRHL